MIQLILSDKEPAAAKVSSSSAAPSVTYYPCAGADSLVLILPGGGYTHLADHEGEPIAQSFNRHGFHAAVLRYRLAPYHDEKIPLQDASSAIRLIRHHAKKLHCRPDRIAILGFSAGGHLAGCTALFSEQWAGDPGADNLVERVSARPDAAILCYPVVTMGEFTHRGSRRALLAEHADDPIFQERYSLEKQVASNAPPIFMWHTADDASVPVQNSLMLAAALADHQIPFSLHIFPHGPHGLGLAQDTPDVSRWPELAAEWLRGLWGAPQ